MVTRPRRYGNAAFALRILARNDKARRHVALHLQLPEAATIGDIDEAIMVASGADAASGLERLCVCGADGASVLEKGRC